MNVTKILLNIFILLGASVGSSNAATDYEEFKMGLFERYQKVQEHIGNTENGAIYSKRVVQNDSELNENVALYLAGKELVSYLQDNDLKYKNLDPPDWVKATQNLLLVNTGIGKQLGWGNLVINVAICNKILNSIFNQLDTKLPLKPDHLKSILDIIRQLRWHIPSERALYFLAFRYYGVSSPFKVTTLNYTRAGIASSKDNHREVMRVIRAFKSEGKTGEDFMEAWFKEEVHVAQSLPDYLEIYQQPIPMNLAYFPGYYKILGSFLMSTQLAIMNDGNPVDVETVSAETLKNIAAQEYANGDEYWLRVTYRNFFESWGEGTEQSQKGVDDAVWLIRQERITELYRSWEKKRIKKGKYLEKLLSKPESKRHKYKKRWSFHIHELP